MLGLEGSQSPLSSPTRPGIPGLVVCDALRSKGRLQEVWRPGHCPCS